MATNPTVLVFPKKKIARRRRSAAGSVWLPTYKVKQPDGTVAVRSSRFYWIRYTVEKNGERERISKATPFTTKEGAQKLLTEVLHKINTGEFQEYEAFKNVTFAQVAAGVRTFYTDRLRRSKDKLETALERLEAFFGADCPVVSITKERISEYRALRLAQPGTQYPTVNRELAALKKAFRLAVADGKMRRMPVIEISSEKERKDEGEFSKEELAALQTTLHPYLRPLIRFLSLTGMRIMEPVGLTWAEVNLEQGELRINGRRTKNGNDKVLHIGNDLLEILKAQPRTCAYVFTDAAGAPLRYDAILDHFQQACRKAGIKEGFVDANEKPREPGFHDLRRTFARMANRAGIPHREIMEIAGWKSEAMLLRYLGVPKPAEQRRAFNALADSIR